MVKVSARRARLQRIEAKENNLPLPDLVEIAARREFIAGEIEGSGPAAPTSMFVDILESDYPIPDWLITEVYIDEQHGTIKSGKEAEVTLVRRVSGSRSNLLARKRYRSLNHRDFRRDYTYREGRKFRRTRDKRAVAEGTSWGLELMRGQWTGAEGWALQRLWQKGASVPYPVSIVGELLMQFIGDETQAAPRLVDARLEAKEAAEAYDQIIDNIVLFTREGWCMPTSPHSTFSGGRARFG